MRCCPRSRYKFPDRELFLVSHLKQAYVSRSGNYDHDIRRTRKAQGLRQPELAAASGVGLRFLVELERGKPTAQIGKMLDVLSALGCALVITTPEDGL
jgi:y4mF family transcriptional regulator